MYWVLQWVLYIKKFVWYVFQSNNLLEKIGNWYFTYISNKNVKYMKILLIRDAGEQYKYSCKNGIASYQRHITGAVMLFNVKA